MKADSILAFVNSNKARRLREVMISFLGLARACLDTASSLDLCRRKDILKVEFSEGAPGWLELGPCEEGLKYGKGLAQPGEGMGLAGTNL